MKIAMPIIAEIQRNFGDIYFNFMTSFLTISVKLIYANKDYDRIATGTILHLLAHVLPFCHFAPPLAGEHIAFSCLESIIFDDFGLPEISLIFIQLSL